jgi:probable phosphoglycerate mutase
LLLVRHGESNATVLRVAGGMAGCTGLSELGRRQSEALRDRWLAHSEVEPDAVVSSDIPRAIETAEIVAPALGDLPIELDAGVREMDPGPQCDGLSWDEIAKLVDAGSWDDDPYIRGFPGGETVAAFQYRVAAAVSNLARRYEGGNVVVFCHGGVVDVALRLFLRTPIVGGFELFTTNTAITEFRQGPERWRMLRYNDAAHLAGLPPATPHPEPEPEPDAANDAERG